MECCICNSAVDIWILDSLWGATFIATISICSARSCTCDSVRKGKSEAAAGALQSVIKSAKGKVLKGEAQSCAKTAWQKIAMWSRVVNKLGNLIAIEKWTLVPEWGNDIIIKASFKVENWETGIFASLHSFGVRWYTYKKRLISTDSTFSIYASCTRTRYSVGNEKH